MTTRKPPQEPQGKPGKGRKKGAQFPSGRPSTAPPPTALPDRRLLEQQLSAIQQLLAARTTR